MARSHSSQRGGRPVVVIAVTDQGLGIAEADRDQIFERFYRVDPARSGATGGTGLGLAIVKNITQNHSGSVQAWSSLGQAQRSPFDYLGFTLISHSQCGALPPGAHQPTDVGVIDSPKGSLPTGAPQ